MLESMSGTMITTVEDLVQVLDENPEWLEALRARLLTRELLEMPATLAEFMAATKRQFEAIDDRFGAIDDRFGAVERRLDRIERHLAPIKGAHARNAAVKEADLIARESGLDFIRILPDEEIRELDRSGDTAGIPTGDLQSFRQADLILEANDSAGQRCFLAVEISYTADERDTTRALRNAALLTRFTGRQAYAAVTGLRYDNRIRDRIESGDVTWYQLAPHALEAD